MIDNHPLEQQAMDCFKKGETKKAGELQDAFLKEVKTSGEDYCSCRAKCKYHGNCVDCVIIHRGHGDHLPACFHDMLNGKIKELAALTEHILKPQNE